MPNLIQSFRSFLNGLRETAFKGLFRARFRYDVFISYSHSDAKDYAVNLKKQLGSLDFACFIDEEESPPGLSLGPTLEKALKKSAVLVLLATERALTRPYIALEFERFAPSGRRIIPINISGALTNNNEQALSKSPWNLISERKLIWIDEAEDAFAKQNPSPPIADGIDKLFKYTRRNVRVRTEIIGTAALVLLTAFGAGFVIKGKNAELAEQVRTLEVAKKDTFEQQKLAAASRKEAETQHDIADEQKKEALKQGKLAEEAKRDATHQLELARTATAEASKQQAVAHTAKLEAEKQLERSRHLRYDSDMNLAQRAHENNEIARLYELLDTQLPASNASGRGDLRSFYWYYLWHTHPRELMSLDGHAGAVQTVAFAPDGKTVASGSADNTAKLWDVNTGQLKATLSGHQSPVTAVAFAPNGRVFATASGSTSYNTEHTVKLWDVSSGKELRTLEGHAEYVSSLAFAPDSETLASGSWDRGVKLWDVNTGKELRSLKETAYVIWLQFTSDGKKLFTGENDNTVKCWDLATGSVLTTIKVQTAYGDYLESVALASDGETLATGSMDYTVKIWSVSTGKIRATLSGHKAAVYSLAFSSDGRTLASAAGGQDPTIKLWDVRTTQELLTLRRHTSSIFSMAFAPDGRTLASASYDRTVKLWDVSRRQELPLIQPDTYARMQQMGIVSYPIITPSAVSFAAMSVDGKTLAVHELGSLQLWDLSTGRRLSSKIEAYADNIDSVSFSPGDKFATGSRDGSERLLDPVMMRQINAPKLAKADTSVSFSLNSNRLAGGSGYGRLKVWEASTGREVATFKQTEAVRSVALSNDGERVASASSDGAVRVWKVSTGREVANFELKGVSSVAFSPNGKILAGGTLTSAKEITGLEPKGVIKLWDLDTLKEIGTLEGHMGSVNSMAFSPDGNTLATGSDDTTVRLWDVSTQQQVATLVGHRDGVVFVWFSLDGKTLVSGGNQGTLRAWFAATEREVLSQRK